MRLAAGFLGKGIEYAKCTGCELKGIPALRTRFRTGELDGRFQEIGKFFLFSRPGLQPDQ